MSAPVEFTVSLTGDFSDVGSSASYYYYKLTRVMAIKPTHGPKSGGTNVQVWGENFMDFGHEEATCAFGTAMVNATIHDSGYITCQAPPSDVVQRGMPFGISLNGQQQSKSPLDYWYYNAPQVTVAEPASGPGPGPEDGGNAVTIRGNNFNPFDVGQAEPDIRNTTFCMFTALDVSVPATIIDSTRATCIAPASHSLRQTPVEISLNA